MRFSINASNRQCRFSQDCNSTSIPSWVMIQGMTVTDSQAVSVNVLTEKHRSKRISNPKINIVLQLNEDPGDTTDEDDWQDIGASTLRARNNLPRTAQRIAPTQATSHSAFELDSGKYREPPTIRSPHILQIGATDSCPLIRKNRGPRLHVLQSLTLSCRFDWFPEGSQPRAIRVWWVWWIWCGALSIRFGLYSRRAWPSTLWVWWVWWT